MALRTRIVLAAVAAALFLALPAGALAMGWTAQQTVSTANNMAVQPPSLRLGVDAGGNAFLSLIADKSPQGAQVAERPLGQGWNATQHLGTISSPGNTPTLAVDAAGNAVVAYSDNTVIAGCTAGTANSCLRVWFKPAGSSA